MPEHGRRSSRAAAESGQEAAATATVAASTAYAPHTDLRALTGRWARLQPAQRQTTALAMQRAAGNRVVVASIPAATTRSGRRLSRRLRATIGDAADWRRFRALVEPASQLRFARDTKTNVVTAIKAPPPTQKHAPKGTPPGPVKLAPGEAPALAPPPYSKVFRDQLLTIIGDPKQDAEIHLGRQQPFVIAGGFPARGGTNRFQKIDLDDIEQVERWTPGFGIPLLLHEIFENYAAHAPGATVDYEAAHRSAIKEEAKIVRDLGLSRELGGRAQAQDPGHTGQDLRVYDLWKHFLVIEISADGVRRDVVRARRVPARTIGSFMFTQFLAGDAATNVNTDAHAKAIKGIASLMWSDAHPLAVLRLVGYTDGQEQSHFGDMGLARAAWVSGMLEQYRVLTREKTGTIGGGVPPIVGDRRCVIAAVVEPNI